MAGDASTPGPTRNRRAQGAASTGCAPARCPTGWEKALPVLPRRREGRRHPRRPPARCSPRSRPCCPSCGAAPPTWPSSNNTTPKGQPSFIPAELSTKDFTGDQYGRVLHFGIREHAMGSMMNGIALHGGTRVYGGTFLIFSDYMRGAVRLAALMQLPVTYVWTHDSIGLGEDGPTHQPVEHLAALRAIPGLDVVRPGRRQRDRRGLAGDPGEHRQPGRPRA